MQVSMAQPLNEVMNWWLDRDITVAVHQSVFFVNGSPIFIRHRFARLNCQPWTFMTVEK